MSHAPARAFRWAVRRVQQICGPLSACCCRSPHILCLLRALALPFDFKEEIDNYSPPQDFLSLGFCAHPRYQGCEGFLTVELKFSGC